MSNKLFQNLEKYRCNDVNHVQTAGVKDGRGYE